MRILICEDSVLLRDGITRLLEANGHEVIGVLGDAQELVPTVAELAPDLVILDVRMPPTFTDEGIQAAIGLRAINNSLPVLVLSQYVEERYASELIVESGGSLGYLLKDRVADVEEFVAAVAEVGAGGTVLDKEVVAQLLSRRRRDRRLDRLTQRETEVLALMAEGHSNAAIASALLISTGSVEKHVTQLFQKLDLTQDDTGNRRVLAVLTYLAERGDKQLPGQQGDAS